MENDVEKWLRSAGEGFLKDIGIRRDQFVLDFGCGYGYYTIPAARVVGERGKVYALDKDRVALTELLRRANSYGIKNIVPIEASGKLDIGLDNESVDAILLYDVLHYMSSKERSKIYSEAYRILRKDGFLSIYPKHNRTDEPLWDLSNMDLNDIIEEVEREKFHLDKKFFKELLHYNHLNKGYILNFKKNAAEVSLRGVKWI